MDATLPFNNCLPRAEAE